MPARNRLGIIENLIHACFVIPASLCSPHFGGMTTERLPLHRDMASDWIANWLAESVVIYPALTVVLATLALVSYRAILFFLTWFMVT